MDLGEGTAKEAGVLHLLRATKKHRHGEVHVRISDGTEVFAEAEKKYEGEDLTKLGASSTIHP